AAPAGARPGRARASGDRATPARGGCGRTACSRATGGCDSEGCATPDRDTPGRTTGGRAAGGRGAGTRAAGGSAASIRAPAGGDSTVPAGPGRNTLPGAPCAARPCRSPGAFRPCRSPAPGQGPAITFDWPGTAGTGRRPRADPARRFCSPAVITLIVGPPCSNESSIALLFDQTIVRSNARAIPLYRSGPTFFAARRTDV